MRRLGVSLRNEDFDSRALVVNDWFTTATGRLNVYTGTADPVASEIPENQWVVFYNSTSNEVRIWTNIAGVALKSAVFT